MTRISLTVDGEKVTDDVEPRMLLVQYLREKLGKTGTVIGCDTSNCGACTVHLNGQQREVVQRAGGPGRRRRGHHHRGAGRRRRQLHPVQEAFRECHGLQCGFCTPGMIMQSVDLLNENPDPTEEEIRLGLEGNLCRCTGYHNIVKAVQYARSRPATLASEGATGMTAVQDRPAIGPRSARDRRRKEDQRLITGRTRWTDNITLPGMLHLAMVRSPFAHANDHRASTPRRPTRRQRRRRLHRRGPRPRPRA